MSLNQAIVLLASGFMAGVWTLSVVWWLTERLDREADAVFEFEQRVTINAPEFLDEDVHW